MAIQTEIDRINQAKQDLKTSINAKLTDTQISDETIDNYSTFVDNIKTGTGNYQDLTNKPQINNVELSGNKTLTDIGVQQTVISETEPVDDSVQVWINPSGDAVTVPTKTSDLINDSGFITNTVNNLTNYTKSSELSEVATSGSYNDLTNKPNVPSKTSDLENDSNFATETYVTNAISNAIGNALGGSY